MKSLIDLCVHCMHKGSFDQEEVTLEKMNQLMKYFILP